MKIVVFLFAILSFAYLAEGQKKDASFYFQKGEDALDAQSYKTALAHFNECLRLDSYFMEAYYSRAQARENLGDPKGALIDFSIYLESKPQNTEALFSRAQLRYQFRQWAMAREDFLKLLTAPPGETKSIFFAVDKESGSPIATTQSNMTATVLDYLGLVDTQMKNYPRAIHYFDSAIKIDPKNADLLVNRAWARQEMLDTALATADYQKALIINPEGSLARHNLAVLSAKKGNLKAVEKLLSEAIERSPEDAHYYTARAINHSAQGDLQKALTDYNSSVQLEYTNADVWMKRGLVKVQLKDWNGALADYTQSIKLKDDNEKIWLCRGDLMLLMNRVKDAIEDYTIAVTHNAEFGIAYYHRALARQRAGMLPEACEDLSQAQNFSVKVDEKLKAEICK